VDVSTCNSAVSYCSEVFLLIDNRASFLGVEALGQQQKRVEERHYFVPICSFVYQREYEE